MQNTNHSSVARFFEEKGFYIILILCLVAIGISGYVLFFSPAQEEPFEATVYEPTIPPVAPVAPVLGEQNDIPVEPVVTDPEPVEAPQEAAIVETDPYEEVAAPVVFVRPIAGEVIHEFSGEKLVFQETMGDWRAHTGADYASKPGDRVYAITDGTVQDVYIDALYGTCVALQHANNLITTYSGLSDKAKVSKGDTVKAGDIIGTVGTGNIAEATNGACLHVEAMQDGTRIDPQSLFTE